MQGLTEHVAGYVPIVDDGQVEKRDNRGALIVEIHQVKHSTHVGILHRDLTAVKCLAQLTKQVVDRVERKSHVPEWLWEAAQHWEDYVIAFDLLNDHKKAQSSEHRNHIANMDRSDQVSKARFEKVVIRKDGPDL